MPFAVPFIPHEAEARAIEEIRKLGNGLLTDWAETAEKAAVAKARAENPKLRAYQKKALTWHSTYGVVSVLEQRLRQGRRGAQERPFLQRAKIRPKGYSLPFTAGSEPGSHPGLFLI